MKYMPDHITGGDSGPVLTRCTPPPQPALGLTSIASTIIIFEVTSGGGTVRPSWFYYVEWGTTIGGPYENSIKFAGNSSSGPPYATVGTDMEFDNLEPDTDYYFMIYPISIDGCYGVPLGELHFQTDAIAPPVSGDTRDSVSGKIRITQSGNSRVID